MKNLNLFSLIILCLMVGSLFSYPFYVKEVNPEYKDEELLELWSSLDNIHFPSVEDYKKVETYLLKGRRPYLDPVFNHGIKKGLIPAEVINREVTWHNRLLQRIKFLGNNAELPNYKIVNIGNVKKKSKCIVLFATYNTDSFDQKTSYTKRLLDLIEEIEQMGFEGHIIYRIGGYPMLERGGIKLAHVPYSFKVLGIIEASLLGFDEVLWLDCSIHPTNNLNKVFNEIKRDGHLLLKGGNALDFDYGIHILPDETVATWGVTLDELKYIPHIVAGVFGVSFKHVKAHEFLHNWYRLTSQTLPAVSLYPEEFLISVSAYLSGIVPKKYIGDYMDVRSQTPKKRLGGKKPFWFDKS